MRVFRVNYKNNYFEIKGKRVTLKSRINFVAGALLCLSLCYSCSTKKNTAGTRAYHELTTRYNIFFNAEEAYNNALQTQINNYKENYTQLLPMYANSRRLTDTVQKKELGGPFNTTVDKMVKAIQEHSIAVKPKRDPAKTNTQEYRDWLRQDEFNPFIDKAWLLMGKAHVENKDYTEAISVFSQASRLFDYDMDVVSEAQIWMMRAYTEMGWFTDADGLSEALKMRTLPKNLENDFNEFYTHLLIRKGDYAEAIPHLAESIKNQSNNLQKQRFRFLLGQLYAEIDDKSNAYAAFENLKGVNTPYEITFNALMQQSQVSAGSDQRKILSDLIKMAKSTKNSEFLDQIYYAIGNIYFGQNDTTKAIENYLLAEKESIRNGIDKALAQIALGDIYFDRKDYVKAEPRYSEAISTLPATHEHYPRVKFRADVLGDLAPQVAAIHEQDSLQHLAKLPPEEQLKIINEYIAEIKKRDRDLAREGEREAYLAEQQAKAPDLGMKGQTAAEAAVATANRGSGQSSFYFYNPQLVSQGRSEFRRRWGNRKLEDNWRLLNKAGAAFGDSDEEAASDSLATDSIAIGPDGKPIEKAKAEAANDRYSPEYYLQKLPTTPNALAASNKTIEEGLFGSGNIVKDRLEDYRHAISIYNRHLKDFPNSDERPNVYYQLYLIYLRLGDRAMAQNYKNKIMAEYPSNEHAIAMNDANYERTMQNFAQTQDSLYQQTYKAYQRGQSKTVHSNYELAKKLFSKGDLMPKFMLLNALSYAQAGDANHTEESLNELVEKYPDTKEVEMAQSILAELSQGRLLAANASALSGIDWKSGIVSASGVSVDSIQFDKQKNVPHSYLLMFPPNSVGKNSLLFAVSNYNFSKFQLRTFSTSFISLSPFEALRIKSFRSQDEANRYAEMIESDSTFRQSIPDNIMPLVISDANIDLLERGKMLSDYIIFYEKEMNPQATHTVQETPADTAVVDSLGVQEPISVQIRQIETIAEPETVITLEGIKIDIQKDNIEDTVKDEQAQEPEKTEETETQPVITRQPTQQRATIEERQAELERKAEEALQEQPVEAGQDREKTLKERARERNEQIKQRERELKEREKQRKEEMKQRERERKKQLKEQERLRKEKLKERERILREREKQRNTK